MALLAEFREFCIVFFVNDGGVGWAKIVLFFYCTLIFVLLNQRFGRILARANRVYMTFVARKPFLICCIAKVGSAKLAKVRFLRPLIIFRRYRCLLCLASFLGLLHFLFLCFFSKFSNQSLARIGVIEADSKRARPIRSRSLRQQELFVTVQHVLQHVRQLRLCWDADLAAQNALDSLRVDEAKWRIVWAVAGLAPRVFDQTGKVCTFQHVGERISLHDRCRSRFAAFADEVVDLPAQMAEERLIQRLENLRRVWQSNHWPNIVLNQKPNDIFFQMRREPVHQEPISETWIFGT